MAKTSNTMTRANAHHVIVVQYFRQLGGRFLSTSMPVYASAGRAGTLEAHFAIFSRPHSKDVCA